MIRFGMLILLLASIAGVFLFRGDRPVAAGKAADPPTAVAKGSTSGTVSRPAPEAASAPATPAYAAPPSDPKTIYRCKEGRRTTYTQAPCADGRTVELRDPVAGFDSRPSDDLAKLVADGRVSAAARADAASPGASSTTRSRVSTTRQCAVLSQQIADIDATTRSPLPARRLDDLRQTRQDVATSMARLGCASTG